MVELWGLRNCSSTLKAKKILDAAHVEYVFNDFTEIKPSAVLLDAALHSVASRKKLFNVTGESYRKGGYKDKVDAMNQEEIVAAMIDDPMLIKRPIVKSNKGISVGFDEAALQRILKR